jgi:hypothetical protein
VVGLALVLLVGSTTSCAARAPSRQPTEPRVAGGAAVQPSSPASGSPARQEAAGPETETCRISGPGASLSIAVAAGTEHLTVTVDGARVSVVPRDRGASSVSVMGALEFEGSTEGLEFFPSAPVEVASGVVQLGPMSVLHETSPRGAELLAQSVEIGTSFLLSEVSIPCSALAFVGSGHPSEEAHRGLRPPKLRGHSCPAPCANYMTPEELDFYASPGGDAHVRLTGSTVASELERRGRWARVSTEDFVHMDGAQLMGWVEHARLRRISGGSGSAVGAPTCR